MSLTLSPKPFSSSPGPSVCKWHHHCQPSSWHGEPQTQVSDLSLFISIHSHLSVGSICLNILQCTLLVQAISLPKLQQWPSISPCLVVILVTLQPDCPEVWSHHSSASPTALRKRCSLYATSSGSLHPIPSRLSTPTMHR